MLALLGPLAPASLDDPIVSDCWRDLSQLQETCNHEKCSNECIGRSDDLFRRWDSCADIHSSIISAFDQQLWQCLERFTDQENQYVCSHMADFSQACVEELTNTFGAVDLVRGSEQCRRVQDGCTGGGGDSGRAEIYYQFPVLLEIDKCADVLAYQGGGPFLNSYTAQCSDAAGCAAELSQVRQLCSDPASAGNLSCADACKGAIDGLFSSADGGASWALCQGVRVPVDTREAKDFDDDFSKGTSDEFTTFGRAAVSLYNTYHFSGCGGDEFTVGFSSGESCSQQRHESSLLLTVILLMLACGGVAYVAMYRIDKAGPLGRPLDARLTASSGGGLQSPSDREATARRFNAYTTATLLLGLGTTMSGWACVWLPVGMVAGITALCAAVIARANLRHLLTPIGSDGHAPPGCCGDASGHDRTKWLEPVSSLLITTAVLCGIGALINLLIGSVFVQAGHQADNGFCYGCAATAEVFCDWPTCFDQCGCADSDAYSCCADQPCSTSAGECGQICQYGALALLSVGLLLLLMAVSIGGVTATNALRRSWRDAHAPAAVGTATATAVPAVVVAEPVGVASPTFVPQATATAVPVMGYPQ